MAGPSKPTYSPMVQRQVRDAMHHHSVFQTDDAIPDDMMEKLARLDEAFANMQGQRNEK